MCRNTRTTITVAPQRCMPRTSSPSEDLVVDVLDRRVRLVGRRAVVHRQEDAGHGLRQEGEHRRRAERVEPVGPLRRLAEHEPARERAEAGALVDPADHGDRDLGGGLLDALALERLLVLGGLAVAVAVDDRLVALARDGTEGPESPGGSGAGSAARRPDRSRRPWDGWWCGCLPRQTGQVSPPPQSPRLWACWPNPAKFRLRMAQRQF